MHRGRDGVGRLAYDALRERGVVAASLVEYTASLPLPAQRSSPPTTTLVHHGPGPLPATDRGAAPPERDDDESVVLARVDDRPVGHVLVGVDTPRRVEPLERTLRFEGAYVRRLRVLPDARRRGVGAALVAAAVRAAADRGGDRATALVGVDNRPSRRLFESLGFRSVGRRSYLRVGPLAVRSTGQPRGFIVRGDR